MAPSSTASSYAPSPPHVHLVHAGVPPAQYLPRYQPVPMHAHGASLLHAPVGQPASPYLSVPLAQPPSQTSAAPHSHHLPAQPLPSERDAFYSKLHAFRDSIGEPIQRLPTLGFKELDLCILYNEVTKRNGIDAVIANKQWKEVAEALQLPSSCTDSGFRLRLHYKKYLEAFERRFFRPVQPPQISEATPSSSSKGNRSDLAALHQTHAPPADKPQSNDAHPSSSVTSVGSSPTDGIGTCSAGSVGSVGSSRTGTSVTQGVHAGKSKPRPTTPIKKKKRASVSPAQRREHRSVASVPVSSRAARASPDVANAQAGVTGQARVADACRESIDVMSGEGGPRGLEKREDGGTELKKRRGGEGSGEESGGQCESKRNKVDFSVLDRATLKRYARKYDVASGADDEKAGDGGDGGEASAVDTPAGETETQAKPDGDLAENVSQHFSTTPLQSGELETLLEFIQAVRRVG